jgi:hypothetical protein
MTQSGAAASGYSLIAPPRIRARVSGRPPRALIKSAPVAGANGEGGGGVPLPRFTIARLRAINPGS